MKAKLVFKISSINLSILDFKILDNPFLIQFLLAINLSILDFKSKQAIPKDFGLSAINLSILDFKINKCSFIYETLSAYKSIHIGF